MTTTPIGKHPPPPWPEGWPPCVHPGCTATSVGRDVDDRPLCGEHHPALADYFARELKASLGRSTGRQLMRCTLRECGVGQGRGCFAGHASMAGCPWTADVHIKVETSSRCAVAECTADVGGRCLGGHQHHERCPMHPASGPSPAREHELARRALGDDVPFGWVHRVSTPAQRPERELGRAVLEQLEDRELLDDDPADHVYDGGCLDVAAYLGEDD